MSVEEKAAELQRYKDAGCNITSPWFDDLRAKDDPPWPWYGSDVY